MASLEGRKAPDFSCAGSDGKTHRLADYAGRPLLIFFYPKDDTPGCTKEACGFRDHFTELAAKVSVVGVSKDNVASHAKFIAKYALPFPLLADPELAMLKAYGAWGEKLMYGKPVMGTVRSTVLVGADGKVVKHWAAVKDAAGHPAEVLAFVRDMA